MNERRRWPDPKTGKLHAEDRELGPGGMSQSGISTGGVPVERAGEREVSKYGWTHSKPGVRIPWR